MKNCTFCFKPINSCGCGLSHNNKKNDIAKSQSIKIIFFSLFLIAVILHMANWNNYFFTIIPLKAKDLIGIAKSEDYIKIATICKDRKKTNCELLAIEKAFQLNPKQKDYLPRAGEIYFKRSNYTAAANILAEYFKIGGTDRSSRQYFAYSLNAIGKYKDAKTQYNYLIKTDKSDPDFQLAREYVQLLIKNKEFKPAKDVIEKYRRSTASAQLFMDQELKTAKAAL